MAVTSRLPNISKVTEDPPHWHRKIPKSNMGQMQRLSTKMSSSAELLRMLNRTLPLPSHHTTSRHGLTCDNIRYPNEVVVESAEGEVAATPEKDDDFFSSWDKPSIKRPTPPPSRTATPPVIGRTPSPLTPGAANGAAGNGIARSKSPLSATSTAPVASRTTTSSALRTKAGAPGARKSGVLGAKKGAKLGAKKLGGSEIIDFDEAEKKAKEEAERIAKLGYDPDAENEAGKKDTGKSKIIAPTPTSPASAKGHQRNSSDVERLGLSMNRLGFGQVAGSQPAKAAPKKMGGFGSVGASASVGMFIPAAAWLYWLLIIYLDEDESFAREKFGTQKSISSDEFFGRNQFDPQEQSEARTRLQNFDGATAISSNQYFGREEEEEAPVDMSDYGQLEMTAREFARRFTGTAGEDLENITQALGQGAGKLQDAMRQYVPSVPAIRLY